MRLLNWPIGLPVVTRSMLSGPRSRGEGNENVEGGIQTTASPFGLQEFQIDLAPFRGSMGRAWRGLAVGLNAGANAVRVPFCDVDRIKPGEAGISGYGDLPWSNEQNWSNGQPWEASYPIVKVGLAAARQTSLVTLENTIWGGRLDVGSWFGFAPFHFGLYHVTEVLGEGTYRVWPPLRKAIAATDYATITPVMAMTIRGAGDVSALSRNPSHTDGQTIRLVEVPDYTIRKALGA